MSKSIRACIMSVLAIFLALVLAASLFPMLFMASSAQTQSRVVTDPVNLIVDPSFETTNALQTDGATIVKGWAHTSGIFGGIDRFGDTPDGQSRGYFVSNIMGVAAGTQFSFFQDVEVEKYTEYRLSFWVRRWLESGTWSPDHACSPLHYGISDPTKGGFVPISEVENNDIGAVYEQVSFTFNSGNLDLIRIQLYNIVPEYDGKGNTGYHFDLFSLNKILSEVDTDTNLVQNGEFEIDGAPDYSTGTESSIGKWSAVGTSMPKPADVYMNIQDFEKAGEGQYPTHEFGGWGTYPVQKDGQWVFALVGNWMDPGMWLRAKSTDPAKPALPTDKKYVVEVTLLNDSPSTDFSLIFRNQWWSQPEGTMNRATAFTDYDLADQVKAGPKNEWFTVSTVIEFPQQDCYGYESNLILFQDSQWNTYPPEQIGKTGIYIKSVVIKEYIDPSGQIGDAYSVGFTQAENNTNANNGTGNAYIYTSGENLTAGVRSALYQDVEVIANTRYDLSFSARKMTSEAVPALHVLLTDGNNETLGIGEMIFDQTTMSYVTQNIVFNTGTNTSVRIYIYADASQYDADVGATGWLIDDVMLYPFAALTSANIVVDGKFVEGAEIAPLLTGSFANGAENILLIGAQVTYISDNTDVVDVQNGSLVAVGGGTANVTATVVYYGQQITTQGTKIEVLGKDSAEVLASVSVETEKSTVTTCNTGILDFTVTMGDGSEIQTNDPRLTMTVTASDSDVLVVYLKENRWYVTARKCGTAQIFVTAKVGTVVKTASLELTVDDGNLLVDSGFEDPAHTAWTVTGDAGSGFDYVISGALQSFSGIGNFWTNSASSQYKMISQDVELQPGNYTLGAMVNRFYGIDSNVWAGTVRFGVVRLNEGVEAEDSRTYTEYDTSYGAGGYGEILHMFSVKEAGTYRVYASFAGDVNEGMGFQLDNLTLKSNPDVKNVAVSLGKDNSLYVDDLAKLKVVAEYVDGTSQTISSYSFTVADESIVAKQGTYILGMAPGTTDVTVTVEIYGEEYTKTLSITVLEKETGGDSSVDSDDNGEQGEATGCSAGIGMASGLAGVGLLTIALCGAVVARTGSKRKNGR